MGETLSKQRLDNFFLLKRGHDLPSQDRKEGKYPVISSSGITGWHSEWKARGPGVVTGRYGTLGEVFYEERDFWPLNTTLYVYDFKKSCPEFVYYFLKALNFDHLSSAAAVPGLDRNVLHSLKVDFPPLLIQEKIAAILSAYDELIDNNNQRISLLEQMAEEVYKEWFVRLRFPGHEQTRIVDGVPEGWELVSINDVAFIHRGRSYRSNNLLESGGLPFVNLKCINRDGGFRRDGLKCYSGIYTENQKVVSGDIVMAVTDMTQERRIVARAGRVPTLDCSFGVISMDLVKIEPKVGISSDFLYGYFRGSDFANNVKQYANGANVLHLSPDRIKTYQIALPTVDVQELYTSFAEPIFIQIETLNLKNENLKQTRDLLLPRLMSGKLSVEHLLSSDI
jgi:type I restriction enzyme S subunit